MPLSQEIANQYFTFKPLLPAAAECPVLIQVTVRF
jgi:hypothetical protein